MPTMTVQASPNKCSLTARVEGIRTDPKFPKKTLLDLLIIDAQDMGNMPNFAKHRIGATVSAYTLEDMSPLTVGTTIQCQAEYIGGPVDGKFHLTTISPQNN